MKKNKKPAAFLLLLALCVLAACGNMSQEVSAVEDELLADAPTNEEILIDSLEYLLQEDAEPLHEKLLETETATETENEETLLQTDVMIYYGNSASDALDTEVSKMEQVTAENLIEALLRHNIVSLGTKVNSFEEEENDGVKTLHLDLSKTFHEYLKTMTKEGENIIMCSVAATFLEAYDADEIAITVEGKVLETEHATYEEPLRIKAQQLVSSPNAQPSAEKGE
ncbi:MAG: GerMN domain-containing protein [Bacillus sp. (in: Bacteria)]|nr:GerMN domain-containing protein [Bacillus sp. (in: firmicutes)]MCM1426746.1 GerMN domain-containing protein [Eubacterium sp.]